MSNNNQFNNDNQNPWQQLGRDRQQGGQSQGGQPLWQQQQQQQQPYAAHAYAAQQAYGQPRDLFPSLWEDSAQLEKATTACLVRVFIRMFCALLVTALVAWTVYAYPGSFAGYNTLQEFIFSNSFAYIGLIIAQLGLVIFLSARVMKMSSSVSNVMFFIYAALMGLTLSVIFIAFDIGLIFQAFMITSLMFGAMAVFGTVTKMDLTRIGGICIMALIGIIIASIANMFFRNDTLTMIVNYIGVLVFIGLTAYDTQRIKRMLASAGSNSEESVMAVDADEAVRRISVIGALILYLDFLNLFLKILSIMGRRR